MSEHYFTRDFFTQIKQTKPLELPSLLRTNKASKSQQAKTKKIAISFKSLTFKNYNAMQNEDDLRALSKILSFLRAVSILILLMHIYWFCYSLFLHLGLTHLVIDKILLGFNAKANLFVYPIYTKLFSIVLLGLSLWGNRGVKNQKITLKKVAILFILGICLFFLNFIFLKSNLIIINILYITSLSIGYILLLVSGAYLSRLINQELLEDVFNIENESFYQETRLLENQYSVNLPSKFYYQKKWHNGWINVVNPFRATIVLGTPGSGKSYAVINNFIKQQIEKGFALYLYDFKYDDLSTIAYNHLLLHKDKYSVTPKFYVINFDNPRKSHRCNPINPKFITDISDAYESAYTIMLNLNRSWIQKQGDFFVESPIILLAAIIWFLKIYKNGKYCTFPHAIELLNKRYKDVFTILTSYDSLENYLSPFMDAWQGGAQNQLQGQIASAKIPLSRMISPSLYWVMSGDDFSLDINNPKEPKILCVGNNPDRQSIYSAALGLYNSRIVKLINKKDQLKSSVIIDELPTIYFRGLDNLIATARSNKVAVCLGFQDFSQLVRDYGDKESKVIQNTVGNIFSGQVVGDTAKSLSERFGKILQKRQSISINRQDRSTSISTQLDMLIPASKISSLSQGMFVGAVSDDFSQKIEQKFFHAQILVDSEKVKQQEMSYKKIPTLTSFTDYKGNDYLDRAITDNYNQIKKDVNQLIKNEIKRIENDANLVHLLNNDN